MSAVTENCVLCLASLKSSSTEKYIGANIDLITLCDILKVSVNAAENYLERTVFLCMSCDANLRGIRRLFCEINRIKKNISKMLKFVTFKLKDSVFIPPDVQKTQFDHIRQGILSDLCNILGLAEPEDHDYNILGLGEPEDLDYPIKKETVDHFSDFEAEDKSYNIINEEIVTNNVVTTENELSQTKTNLNENKKNLRSNCTSTNDRNEIVENKSIQEKDYEVGGNTSDEENLSSESDNLNVDPDFSGDSDSDGSENEQCSTTAEKEKISCPSSERQVSQIDEVVQKAEYDPALTAEENEKMEALKQMKEMADKRRKSLWCEICQKQFGRTRLPRHMREVHGVRESLKCTTCDKVYVSRQGFQEHMASHSEEFNPLICIHCGKNFLTKHSLMHHERIHIQGKIYECDICHKKWTTKSNLKAHMECHSTERKYICDLCGKTFKLGKHFKTHMRIHKQIAEKGPITVKCDHCEKIFKSKESCRIHTKRYHGEQKIIHQCTICGKILSRRDHLRNHMKSHQSGN